MQLFTLALKGHVGARMHKERRGSGRGFLRFDPQGARRFRLPLTPPPFLQVLVDPRQVNQNTCIWE